MVFWKCYQVPRPDPQTPPNKEPVHLHVTGLASHPRGRRTPRAPPVNPGFFLNPCEASAFNQSPQTSWTNSCCLLCSPLCSAKGQLWSLTLYPDWDPAQHFPLRPAGFLLVVVIFCSLGHLYLSLGELHGL